MRRFNSCVVDFAGRLWPVDMEVDGGKFVFWIEGKVRDVTPNDGMWSVYGPDGVLIHKAYNQTLNLAGSKPGDSFVISLELDPNGCP